MASELRFHCTKIHPICACREDEGNICRSLSELGIVAKADAPTQTRMAFGMFDTRGKVDPFDPDSPIKKGGITEFPGDLFFILRVVQLIRGMASGRSREGPSHVSGIIFCS